MSYEEEMHEVMIDCFMDIQGDMLEGKGIKDILKAWVTWIDARYKVVHIPDACYAIIDCETGELETMVNEDMPNAKEQINNMCAALNHTPEEPKEQSSNNMIDAQAVADAFLNMDETAFIDFLMSHTQEREE